MQVYESIFITPVELKENQLDEILKKIKNLITSKGGEVKTVEKWGRRRMAYSIRQNREGFYVFYTFQGSAPILTDLTRFYNVSDQVIRHLTVQEVRRSNAHASGKAETPVKAEQGTKSETSPPGPVEMKSPQ